MIHITIQTDALFLSKYLQESFNFKLEETDLDMSCVKVIGMIHHAFPEKGNSS